MSQKKAWKRLNAALRCMGLIPIPTKYGDGSCTLELRDDEIDRTCAEIPLPLSRRTPVGMLRTMKERGFFK